MRRRLLLAIMLGALMVMPTAGAGSPPPNAAAPVVYVTRHYDTPAGERDPDLTATGTARAQALAAWFKGKKLAAIYVTGFKRTQQTVAPLAAARRLTPVDYGPAPSPAFLAELKATKGPVLVIGHSSTVPDIVAGIGGERPAEIAHPDFGTLWIVDKGRTAQVRIAPAMTGP